MNQVKASQKKHCLIAGIGSSTQISIRKLILCKINACLSEKSINIQHLEEEKTHFMLSDTYSAKNYDQEKITGFKPLYLDKFLDKFNNK